ncbi:MAG: phosphoribosylformylglycinamidine synthase subunit PurS [Bacteroidetes bacterium]|nr:phosphoribosylformylglycinamidine synthase subunit PurS [Bacteroidota bacterium]
MFKAIITVKLRPSILDPEGKAIEHALQSLDFKTLSGVRIGKLVEMQVDAADRAAAEAVVIEACRQLLANQVMEDYTYELHEA